MINTSQLLQPRPDYPIDPTSLLVIGEVHGASQALGLPVFIVGAVARIILLENVLGLKPGRATTDVDFAFAVDDWAQFNRLKEHLLSNADFEQAEHIAHRLLFRPPNHQHRYKVDLIPFGGVESTPNTIAWPPEMAELMNVAGFADAMAAAVTVEVQPGMVVSVASLPGIAILKLFAWADRGHENPKDALDLVLLLRSYHEAGNAERVYEDESALEAADYDVELTCAWLLGRDAAAMASPETTTNLQALLDGPKRQRLTEDMARAMIGREDAVDYARRLLEQFTKGLTA